MEEKHVSSILTLLAFTPIFLVLISFIRELLKKIQFPYTVSLLLVGFVAQFITKFFHIDTHLVLDPEVIFYIILPILLFEAALHINFHQFKLQFKTISFISTFGLLISLFVVGAGLTYTVGMPFGVALLFGALISATDPIAVLALFKTLGAPKRLALLADGESMFNDATAVIAFRLISSFVVVEAAAFETQKLFSGLGEFLYVFFGSLAMGLVLGYLTSMALAYIKKDRLVETTLTIVLAFGSFYYSEHLFHLSGVITTVIAGLTLGNLGKTKISEGVMPFIEEIWEYLGYISLSMVFFFAAFNLDFGIFAHEPWRLVYVIFFVLLARALSVYITFFITNNVKFFDDEPNVPMSWQHVINWGGLRGVIPLVLALSLPEHFEYKDDIIVFTMGSLLFTLFINGLTVEKLLLRLGLHIPRKEEELIKEEGQVFGLEEIRSKLHTIKAERDFDSKIVDRFNNMILKEEKKHKEIITKISKMADVETGLKVEAIEIERRKLFELHTQGFISDSVYHNIDAHLDLQADALEYPEVYKGRGYRGGGFRTSPSLRIKLEKLRELANNFPLLSLILGIDQKTFIQNRYSLLRARLVTTNEVYKFLDKSEKIFNKNGVNKAIKAVRKFYKEFEKINQKQINELAKSYPDILKIYQEKVLNSVIEREFSLAHSQSH